MKRIAVFGGSFDPIHIGHLALANWFLLMEQPAIDHILLLPTVHNPLKENDTLFTFEQRLSFIEQSVRGDRRFLSSGIESGLPAPHYTLDTLRALRTEMPKAEFLFILGSDSWQNITHWYHYQELLETNRFLIYPRRGTPIDPATLPSQCIYAADAPAIEVSSSFIRAQLRKGQDVRFFLPQPNLMPQMQRILSNDKA